MSEPDRRSPYHLVFGADSMDDTLFPPIAGEAEARDHPLDDPDRFPFLTSVGRLLQAIAGEPSADDGGESFHQHARLIFHAFHFWRAGRREFELTADRVRPLLDRGLDSLDRGADDGMRPTPPAPAGYLRLPRNLLWAAPVPGQVPEPVDGFFWVVGSHGAGLSPLHLLMALGVRPDRAGFSVVTASGAVEEAPEWAAMEARPGGRDFATTLPGGDLDRLHSIETTAELLKLASLCFLALGQSGG